MSLPPYADWPDDVRAVFDAAQVQTQRKLYDLEQEIILECRNAEARAMSALHDAQFRRHLRMEAVRRLRNQAECEALSDVERTYVTWKVAPQ